MCCVPLEGQLKQALLELSSSQFIIKLLYEELNEAMAKHRPVCGATAENKEYEESALPTAWSKVTPKY
jgi:hypothetical protein